MSTTLTISPKTKATNKRITRKRIEIEDEVAALDGEKMADTPLTINPEDIIIMYGAKMCAMLLEQKVASQNIIHGYKRAYEGVITPDVETKLMEMADGFDKDFDASKKRAVKIVEQTPLWARLSGIKGFSAYQLGLIMGYVKDIRRFNTPSKLVMYAGLGSVNGIAVQKSNINKIKEEYAKMGKEWAGFNTKLAQRLYITCDTLIKSKGFFFNFYQQLRTRLHTQAINEGKAVLEGERYMMKDRNKYSLDAWTNNNARRRVQRTLLHLIYTEWSTIAGVENIKNPYAQDYLGHQTFITLDQVLKADSVKIPKPRKPKPTDENAAASEEE